MTKLVLIDSDNEYKDIRSLLWRYVCLFELTWPLCALSESIKTSFVTNNRYKCVSDSRFPGHRVIQYGLVLLAAGDNLTFTKKSKQVNNFLDESYTFTNSIRYQGEC